MNIFWSTHAEDRFLSRALIYGIQKEDIDAAVIHQKVRFGKGLDKKHKTQKFETIDKIKDYFFTIEKAEKEDMIYIITLWESKKKEVDLWLKKIK